MSVLVTDRRTDGSAQTVLDAVNAFLTDQPFERARLRVECFPKGNALWRGKRLVALYPRHYRQIEWNIDMYVSPTLELQAAHGIQGVPQDADWYGASNAVLDVLLIARWPRNCADSCSRESRLLNRYKEMTWERSM